MLLAEYNFEIRYARGSENRRADALSQRPDYITEEPPTEHQIFEMSEKETLVLQRLIAATFQVCNTRKASLEQYNRLILISEETRDEYIREQHVLPAYRHQGVAKTYKRITRTHNALGLRARIEKVIQECQQYIVNKLACYKLYRELQEITTPDHA